MAARPDQVVDMRVFDAYFTRADADRDGRISGSEAVAFFQGSGLPRNVLAQAWMYADQKRAGFLGREEFYNALRLVTVAQRGIQLTPDTVQAVLKIPDAAKIPAPKINPVPGPPSQMNIAASSPPSQMGAMVPTNQNTGLRAQPPLANAEINRHAVPFGNHVMRPPQTTQVSVSPLLKESGQILQQGNDLAVMHPPSSVTPSFSADWFSGRNSGTFAHETQQLSVARIPPSANQDGLGVSNLGSAPGIVSKPYTLATTASIPSKATHSTVLRPQPDSKALVLSGNGFSSDSNYVGDVFSLTQVKQANTLGTFPESATPNSSNNAPVIKKVHEADAWQNMALVPSGENQTQPQVKQNQPDTKQSGLTMTISSDSIGIVGFTSTQPQLPWPKFTQSDIQRYLAIFFKVDNDRDGKITGEEARNLFLSWRLPREVLKQVWDLSDQDNDGMLSLREFCISLYLMERHHEKRPLPTVLPGSIASDQTLLLATNQPLTGYGGPVSQPAPGLVMPQPPMPATVAKPPMQKRIPLADDSGEPVQLKSRVPVLEKYLVDQLSKEEQSALNTKFQEASDADKKVQDLEKEILDSKEKSEFYRSKMQELVLYKSRCDNRLNEVTERASADKREAESLTKRYEQKCKQLGDVASKLTIEEATFHDIQEKKMEIYNAILKIGQGETADGSLQARADHIQKDLEELIKILNERSKQYGLRAKPTTLVELPFGWQAGIQEGSADWNEDWDKFEEEGFSIIKELTIEVEKAIPTEKPKPQEVQNEKHETEEGLQATTLNGEDKTVATFSDAEEETVKPSNSTIVKPITENGSTNLDRSDNTNNSHADPGSSAMENSKDLHPLHARHDDSSHADENSSDHENAESYNFDDKHAVEPSWGPTFDRSDDIDSVWSYNSKEADRQVQRKHSFGSDDFGLFPPIKTDSPSAASVKGPFFDSVPSTPLYGSGYSPKFSEAPDDHSFNSLSQHDFFNTHDTSSFGQRDSLARFDSFRSTTDYSRGESFAASDSMSSIFDHRRGESFARFDSMRSTADYTGGFSSFDGVDLFGSGPFKSSDNHSPKKGTTNWDAF
ncbi:intersectin-1-like isoform X1 [Zingiber officinale]|uniref:intersectin-1-like isoform X1 n=1 Tax=Zingiber officinale TaxID=94328 RepID=UPI001C4A986C|nr:intersectin-1-like isoform X1 [Zingiber officinale]